MKLLVLDAARDDLIAGFAFAIYYTVENNAVIIRAILDCRRNPSWIRSRLRND